jgi:DNA-binding SARP family transcriptional activator
MKFDLLGQLRVVKNGTPSFISARKIETVLAVLLIRADHVVTMDQLIQEIWGDRPPRRAAAGLHVYISQLRKLLQEPGDVGSPVLTCSPGYLFRTRDYELDFQVFLDLVSQARACLREDDREQAVRLLQWALGLWRGPALGDLRIGPIVNSFVTWLEETRIECVETLVDIRLELGAHREVVGNLYSLIAEHPLHEAFYRQLMLALYRANRQADALNVYRMARATVHEELGVEPCRDLQDLHRAILTADHELTFVPAQ